jgi:hypothetical protein
MENDTRNDTMDSYVISQRCILLLFSLLKLKNMILECPGAVQSTQSTEYPSLVTTRLTRTATGDPAGSGKDDKLEVIFKHADLGFYVHLKYIQNNWKGCQDGWD